MKVELELKNGRRKAFPEKLAKVLVKRGVGAYQTRELRAESPAPAPSPAAHPQAEKSSEESMTEADKLRAELDSRGITYHHRAGVAKLRELLEA